MMPTGMHFPLNQVSQTPPEQLSLLHRSYLLCCHRNGHGRAATGTESDRKLQSGLGSEAELTDRQLCSVQTPELQQGVSLVHGTWMALAFSAAGIDGF